MTETGVQRQILVVHLIESVRLTDVSIKRELTQGFIKGQAKGKLTSCEHAFAQLLLTLGF